MEREELVVSYRDYYGQYHHHKEQMAYAARLCTWQRQLG